MIERTFRLVPFPAPHIPPLSIAGGIAFQAHNLSLRYELTGDLDQILLPRASSVPGRKDELWKSTCFEFFLAFKDRPTYWEFNFSPAGDWNVYRMEAYRREGFAEESRISPVFLQFRYGADRMSLEASVDLAPVLEPGPILQIGITAVIQTKDGQETYWALTHPGPQADFHLRNSFILELAEQTHRSPQGAPGG